MHVDLGRFPYFTSLSSCPSRLGDWPSAGKVRIFAIGNALSDQGVVDAEMEEPVYFT